MRLLVTTAPAYGHLHPLVPLALAARDAGHDVVVATGGSLKDWVTASGLRHVTAGHDGSAFLTAEEAARADAAGADRGPFMFTTLFAPLMARDLLALFDEWLPDVIVHEEMEFAAPLVASLRAIPCVTHSYAAPARTAPEQELLRELIAPVWRQFSDAEPRLSGQLYLDACPPAFQTDAVQRYGNVRPIRPIPFDGPPAEAPPWLDSLTRPAAYVTLGTVRAFARPETFARVIEALANRVGHLVVTTGPVRTDALTLPDNVIAEQYVRQSLVLAAVDVVVSHGGAGTTLGALQFGLPHVVLPQAPYSQLRNAQRIQELGIGLHVAQDEAGTEAIRDAFRSVLADPSFAANAVALRRSIEALPSPADVVVELASEFS